MIYLAYPYVTEAARRAVYDVLGTRFIGQGPLVDEFETLFQTQLKTIEAVAVGSGTDALHLAYILSNIKPGDDVLVPNFTCTATNIPLLWMKANLIFVDIKPGTLNVDPEDIKRKITPNTKAIVTVDYAGVPCDYEEIFDIAGEIPVIEDAAHSIGAIYRESPVGSISKFTTFSFQAIKHIPTGDGGMITMEKEFVDRARLLRWFGIDRKKKLTESIWKNDITEIGYKYQMTDIAASMGIEGLRSLPQQLVRRKEMYDRYVAGLKDCAGIQLLEIPEDRTSAYWLMTILAEERDMLQQYLRGQDIESSPMHYRNDQYSIFKKYKNDSPVMDSVENKILCIPFHMNLTNEEIDTVIDTIYAFYS